RADEKAACPGRGGKVCRMPERSPAAERPTAEKQIQMTVLLADVVPTAVPLLDLNPPRPGDSQTPAVPYVIGCLSEKQGRRLQLVLRTLMEMNFAKLVCQPQIC